MRSRLVVLIGVVVLVVAACGGGNGGQLAGVEEAAGHAPAPVAHGGTGGPADEGIEVHGHWQIDVLDAGGALVRTVEFENALASSGDDALTALLSRQASVKEWRVSIDSASASLRPCVDASSADSECWMTELAVSSPNFFQTLTLDATAGDSLVLAGQVTVANDSAIDRVSTTIITCASTIAPDDCPSASTADVYLFTVKNAADSTTDEFDPVPVTADQIVQVSVTLSFS